MFSTIAWGQELPDFLQMNLNRAESVFESYNNKSFDEIADGNYNEEDLNLFAQVEQVEGLDLCFARDDIKAFKIELIKLISDKFSTEQLLAISSMAKSKEMNKKSVAKYFELALSFKTGSVDESRLKKRRI